MPAARELALRRRLKKSGIRLVARFAPLIYFGYMRCVVATSRVVRVGMAEMLARRDAGKNIVLAVLHQDLILSPFLFRDLGIVTLANVGDAGDVIAAVLERCDFEVMRGGSSRRASRRSTSVIRDLIARMRERSARRGMIAAVTPDGSHGPPGAVKPGLIFLAMKASAEIFCLKIHASRALYAPTWDRTALPLPFCEIRIELEGPLTTVDGQSRDRLEALRCTVEQRLHAMHERAFARVGRRPVPRLHALET